MHALILTLNSIMGSDQIWSLSLYLFIYYYSTIRILLFNN